MTPIATRAGQLCVAAAALIVSSEFLRLLVGLLGGPDSVTTPAHTLTYGLALAGTCVLLIAVTAVYAGHHRAFGRLGLAGCLAASLGTLLVAGDWGFEAFAISMLGAHGPDVLALPPGGSVLAGAVITSSLFAVGWILFGVAAFRSRALSRAAVLLVMGGACGFLALSTPYQVPLAVAVGWLGYRLRRTSQHESAVVPSPQPAPDLVGNLPTRQH